MFAVFAFLDDPVVGRRGHQEDHAKDDQGERDKAQAILRCDRQPVEPAFERSLAFEAEQHLHHEHEHPIFGETGLNFSFSFVMNFAYFR